MPSSPSYRRNYKREYATAKKRGEVGTGPNGDNAKRKRLRRQMEKAGKVEKGQDVNHKTPLSKGGSNSMKNAEAVSPSKNRSFPRTSSGAMKFRRQKK